MLYRHYFAEYERMSKKILRYREVSPPLNIVKQYEKVLSDLREHLLQNNMSMPLPRYPYDPENTDTHSHLPNKEGPGSILNPRYRYKNVWKRIDGVKGVR